MNCNRKVCGSTQVALAIAFLVLPHTCCNAAKPSFHKKYGWQAEKFFDDPKVVALCQAIEANDLEEIDRLVAAGADANAKGKGNMTPLLWAYPENHPERFKRILEHGADPNVLFESDFNTRMSIIRPGDSVTHMVCATTFDKYFDYVFQHGGDPNLVHPEHHETPIFTLLRGLSGDKREKVERLIELGADLEANKDSEYKAYVTPVQVALSCFGQYDLALLLLKAGANYRHHRPDHSSRLIHGVEGASRRIASMDEEKREDFRKLVRWLEQRGESIEEAAKDKKKWRMWREDGTFKRNMAREVEELKARLAREAEQSRAKKEKTANRNENTDQRSSQADSPSLESPSN